VGGGGCGGFGVGGGGGGLVGGGVPRRPSPKEAKEEGQKKGDLFQTADLEWEHATHDKGSVAGRESCFRRGDWRGDLKGLGGGRGEVEC